MTKKINPWAWVPTLYYTEGIPYIVVMSLSVIMYKRLDISNAEIAFYTSWLYLPWVIKPFWSPIVDILKTKRFWFISMQLIIGASFAGIALTIPTDNFFQITLAFLWLLAFSSATHDIAADGFYMIALNQSEQAFFIGIRSTFYRLAMITGQGLLVILAGSLEESLGNIKQAWIITFFVLSALMLIIFLYHFLVIPKQYEDASKKEKNSFIQEFIQTVSTFFTKKGILLGIAFLLLFRLGEAQLVKLAQPFLLDKTNLGGLAFSTTMVGTIYGTIGLISLSIGGILGGVLVARQGLKYWIWWMLLAINLPNGLYFLLSVYQPDSFLVVSIAVAIEQFGYGFGFTAYLMYMLYMADGHYKTAHYALCTGFMALGMMIPGMFSGWLQESLGYPMFFSIVLLSAIPCAVLLLFLKIPAEFGKKKSEV